MWRAGSVLHHWRTCHTGAMRVVIVGQGYVGLPLAMRAVAVGHEVVGFDVSEQRCKRLMSADSYVEDVSDGTMREALRSGRYVASTDHEACRDFEVAVITVPTPLRAGAPDLSFIEEAAGCLGPYLCRGATVILESTTYPGTTVEVLVPILQERSGLCAGGDFHVGYSPERIDPGNPRFDLRNTPKVVSGIDAASLAAVQEFYDSIVDTTVAVSEPAVAELTKILENTFRHVNIALVNELAMCAADLGVDVWEAIGAASTKPFGFMPFTPGPGVGGHCLPVDPSYLSWRVEQRLGFPFRFIDLANNVNDHMPDYVARRVSVILNRRRLAFNGSRVLILGLAYKRNSGDCREAPGPVVCDRLNALGAEVRAVDPYLVDGQFPASATAVELTEAELAAADLAIVVTDHDCFDWDMLTDTTTPIFDTRHRLPPLDHVEHL